MAIDLASAFISIPICKEQQQKFIFTALFQSYVNMPTFCHRKVERDVHNDRPEKIKVVLHIDNIGLIGPDEQELARNYLW